MRTGPGDDVMSATEHWYRDVVVDGQKVIEADPNIVDAFKNIGYSLEAAIADLVDNSIDAHASIVLIRFLRTDDEILSLVVVDNGRGMRETVIDRAMQFGGRRTYAEGDLGMYGMGLKSASLSQADSVTVLSRARASDPIGRRWTEAQAKAGWKCDIVSKAFVADELDRQWGSGLRLRPSGTVIRWDHVRDFQKASGRVDAYLRRVRIAIANHLGLQLHRFLSRGELNLLIDTENVESGEVGIQTPVTPLDPFAYGRSGARGYPKKFKIMIRDMGEVDAMAHIWPSRSKLPGYKLGGGAVSRRQGFYFYRNDRLIQAGGWNNLRDDAEPHVSLARVEVDLPLHLERFFSVRFNKSGVDAPRSFVDALEVATADDGTKFLAFIERAIEVYRTRSEAKLKPVVPPGAGIHAEVKRAVRQNLPVIPRDDEVDVIWGPLPWDQFFEIDRDERILLLNSKYRKAVLGGRRASAADAPLTKALLYLLVNDMLRTQRESAIERETVKAYQAILVAAASRELR